MLSPEPLKLLFLTVSVRGGGGPATSRAGQSCPLCPTPSPEPPPTLVQGPPGPDQAVAGTLTPALLPSAGCLGLVSVVLLGVGSAERAVRRLRACGSMSGKQQAQVCDRVCPGAGRSRRPASESEFTCELCQELVTVCVTHTSSAVVRTPAAPHAGGLAGPGATGTSVRTAAVRPHATPSAHRTPATGASVWTGRGDLMRAGPLGARGPPGGPAWTAAVAPSPAVPPLPEERRQQAADHAAAEEALQKPDHPGLQDAGRGCHQHGRGEAAGGPCAPAPGPRPRAALPKWVPRVRQDRAADSTGAPRARGMGGSWRHDIEAPWGGSGGALSAQN